LGPDVPAWGAPDANSVHDKILAAGRYWRTTPPRGALIVWKYGRNGHAAISAGGGKIVTTDPPGDPGGTGYADLDYPARWGAGAFIWTDTYNGVRFPVAGDEGDDMPLSDDDIDRIARRVWGYIGGSETRDAYQVLRDGTKQAVWGYTGGEDRDAFWYLRNGVDEA
jgi:hypothetical protein